MEFTRKQKATWAALAILLTVGTPAISLGLRALFGPTSQAVERGIYENSPSYIQGKDQVIAKQKLEYAKAKDAGAKSAIKGYVLHEAATVDRSKLSIDNQAFISQLEAN